MPPSPPHPSLNPANLSNHTGARSLFEFISGFASKRLLFACIVWYKMMEIGLATLQSDWLCAVCCFTLATLTACIYIWSETKQSAFTPGPKPNPVIPTVSPTPTP